MAHGRTTPRNVALRCIPIKVSGVYRITNTLNGKIYIGSAGDVRRRLRHHLTMLRNGTHTSPHLQRAFTRYGENAFTFDILATCDKIELLTREQEFLDDYKSYDPALGYNTCKIAGSGPVVVYTEEMRAAISARFKGKPKSEDHRRKIGDAQKTRTCSADKRTQISNSLKRFFSDPKNRAAQSARQTGITRRGTPCSEERKHQLSQARSGIPKPELRKYSVDDIMNWMAMRDAGMTWFAISVSVNVQPAMIQRAIKRHQKENPRCP